MNLTGVVKNGVIVLDNGTGLPDGTRVDVVVKSERPSSGEETKPTLLGLLPIAGNVKNLPPDFAVQHDHYLHGTPKR